MLLIDALNKIIDDGIEAARQDYSKPRDNLKREGAIRGFEECRGKSPEEIALLLKEATEAQQAAFAGQAHDYWYWRCRQAEIEWVANVVSAILHAQGVPPIATVTARGMLKAAEIIGTK
jgi:hypothetical protein